MHIYMTEVFEGSEEVWCLIDFCLFMTSTRRGGFSAWEIHSEPIGSYPTFVHNLTTPVATKQEDKGQHSQVGFAISQGIGKVM